MKKQRKRFETAQQINDAIDQYKSKARKMIDHAVNLEYLAGQLAMAGPLEAENVLYKRAVARKLRVSAFNIEKNKLPKLKEKLSEFMTPQLPGLDDGDPSIPAKLT